MSTVLDTRFPNAPTAFAMGDSALFSWFYGLFFHGRIMLMLRLECEKINPGECRDMSGGAGGWRASVMETPLHPFSVAFFGEFF